MEFDHQGLVLFLRQHKIDFVWEKKSNLQSRFLMLVWMKYQNRTDPALVKKALNFLNKAKKPQTVAEQDQLLTQLKYLIGENTFNDIMNQTQQHTNQ
jgi:hypothetical protein